MSPAIKAVAPLLTTGFAVSELTFRVKAPVFAMSAWNMIESPATGVKVGVVLQTSAVPLLDVVGHSLIFEISWPVEAYKAPVVMVFEISPVARAPVSAKV